MIENIYYVKDNITLNINIKGWYKTIYTLNYKWITNSVLIKSIYNITETYC